MWVSPRASAESRRMRFEMLFDPGNRTLPVMRVTGWRSRYCCKAWPDALVHLSIVVVTMTGEPRVARVASTFEKRAEPVAIRRDQQRIEPVELGTVVGKFAP